ncbi:esterase [Williamsia sp. Leaf354]|uniref:patatin-like phospholipase family protein n=1 Tax=Williamsia sp. Leaf354 TaxID=1736349 RepID=UPI0006FA402E|nr:patatin-like phospholipase family protein [Williamsia sp. Leaf354]KQR97479.1 esterase [Williamsia sp. Leaf354]
MSRTTVAVALGSGGARGYAHIGVLQVLAEHDYEIVAIAGSSMGALIAGLHAAGRLDQYTTWVQGLNQLDVMRLMDVSLSAPGVIHAAKILDKVREILGVVQIEDLPIPFTAVATDLTSGRPKWFQKGPVDTAIRASIAIPGVITPYVHNGRVLVDGGILDPVPIAPLAAAGADLIIGVDLGADTGGIDSEVADTPTATVPGAIEAIRQAASPILDRDFVRSIVDRFAGDPGANDADTVDADSLDAEADSSARRHPETESRVITSPADDSSVRKLSRFTVMDRSLDIMQEALARYQLAAFPPDLLIEVPRTAIRSLDFHRAGEMIDLGRTLTERALDDLQTRRW